MIDRRANAGNHKKMNHVLNFPGFRLEADVNWKDITDSLEDPNMPFTLAKPDGVGALQFSSALYRSGPVPRLSTSDLLSMATELGQSRGLGEAIEKNVFEGTLVGAAASFHSEGAFVRMWYVTDRRNIMLATYVCDWNSRDLELTDCEKVIRTIEFVSG